MAVTTRFSHEPVAGATSITLLPRPSNDIKSKLEKLSNLCSKLEDSEAPSQPGIFSGFQDCTLVKAKKLLRKSLYHGNHSKVETKELETLDMLLGGILRRRQKQSDFEKAPSMAETMQGPGNQSLVVFAVICVAVIVSGEIYISYLDYKRLSQPEESEAPEGKLQGQPSEARSGKYPSKKWQKRRRRRWTSSEDNSVASFIRKLVIICITVATFSVPIWHTLVLWGFV